MAKQITIDKIDFEINPIIKKYIDTQIDIVRERQIAVEYLTEEKITIYSSVEIFNKILDNLFHFSLKGLKSIKNNYIQFFLKEEHGNLLILYSDASSPVFIESDFFNFEEMLKYRRGFGVMFIEKYVNLLDGNIKYVYGKKWHSITSNLTSGIKSNHGFIIHIPTTKLLKE